MTTKTFRDMMARRPFQPVRLTMSSGETFEVRHPEMAFVDRTSIYVAPDLDNNGIPTEYRIFSFLHVTAIEPIQTPSAA